MSCSIEKIAELAQVSISTVSRALSGKNGVSPEKRLEIQELAQKHGYVPDLHARSLRSGKGTELTIITPVKTTGIASIRNQTLFSLGKRSFGSVRILVQSGKEDLEALVQTAITQRSRAIISSNLTGELSAATIEKLRQKRIPFISIDAHIPGVDRISIDRTAGTYQAARMLLLSKCKNIFYYSNVGIETPDRRLHGIIQAYRSLGKNPSEIKVFPFPKAEFEGGYNLARYILDTHPVDGLFCYNDDMAIGTLRALWEAGVHVPQDVKVIGFDNIPVTEFLPIPLTTIAQPVQEVVEKAMTITLDRIEDFDQEPRHFTFPAKLIARASAPILSHDLRKEIFQYPNTE